MSQDSILGRQIDEYRIEKLLGKGGMARVYQGIDVNLQRKVAIKVIDTPYQTDSDYLTRFKLEAQAIAQLEHPHIVRLYRYGDWDGMLYMAMQYVEGVDLHAVLSSYREAGEFIEFENASRILRDICEALDYVHQHGVIHRDIKPSNIMISADDRAILADFGLALLRNLGTRGEILGSPDYIAPEQAISSANAVPQSDLYAVGALLYEMMTGQLPFSAENPYELAMMHVSETPPRPSALRPDIGTELEVVILKAMAKEPADRYPTGRTLADALDHALGLGEDDLDALTPAATHVSMFQRVQSSAETMSLPLVPAAVSPSPGRAQPEPPAVVSHSGGPPPTNKPSAPRLPIVLGVGGIMLALVLCCSIMGGIWIFDRVRSESADDGQPAAAATTVPLSTKEANETVSPSSTESGGVLDLLTATDSIETVLLPSPTEAAETPLPTSGETPTLTSSFTPTPEPPILDGSENVLMVYDDNEVWVINQSNTPLSLFSVNFKRVSDRGEVTAEFAAEIWGLVASKPISALPPEGCFGVFVDSFTQPAECTSIWGYVQASTNSGLGRQFWRYTNGSNEFQVFQNDKVIQTCMIADGRCEFQLP
jgi:serine/threonine protein kinase